MDQQIGVFFGSRSPEHDVSIITAQLLLSGLRSIGRQAVPIYIDKNGQWYISSHLTDPAVFSEKNFHFQKSDWTQYSIDLKKSVGKLVFRKNSRLSPDEIVIDLAFPAFHGSYGEDGTIQGLFEMFDVPYVGCTVASSAIAMDKVLTKQYYTIYGYETTKFLFFHYKDWTTSKTRILKEIGTKLHFPVFVKPSHLGSSIGIQKVTDKKDLEFALDVAFHYDEKVLIEQSVENLVDITCCVIGNDDPIASELQESLFNNSFFSFEDKYLRGGGTQLGKAKNTIIIPARIPHEITHKIKETALSIYKNLECSGIARIDFLYDKKRKISYANEINPLPGTVYHHLWKASGVAFGELLTKLLDFALERHEAKKRISYIFQSSILSNPNGSKLASKLGI